MEFLKFIDNSLCERFLPCISTGFEREIQGSDAGPFRQKFLAGHRRVVVNKALP
jgi:hypothetical protein